jgi:hypothetical protein
MYINDKRVGEWVGFDYQGVLAQRYNFSSGELLYDRSIADSSLYNLDRKPVFVGGAPCLHNFLINNFSYSGIFEVEKDSTFAVVSFIIDGFGNVHSPTITKSSGSKPLEKELLRLVLATQGNWLPAVKAGQKTMAYVYRIRKDIVTVKKGDRTREFRAFFRVVEQDGSYSL